MKKRKDPEHLPEALQRFWEERGRLNETVLEQANQVIKRFFSLDTQTYQSGALDVKTKELLGLVASMVLRCDDCIRYHLIRCYQEGINTAELTEALAVALVVGGSITIPHLRRAFRDWKQLAGQSPVRGQENET